MDILNKISGIKIDGDSRAPKYRQFADALCKLLESGKIPEGVRLPSLRKIGAALDISFLTVSKAVNELSAKGFLDTIGGSGIYVAEKKKKTALPVGLIIGDQKHYMTHSLLQGISRELGERGINILINDLSLAPQNLRASLSGLIEGEKLGGLIVSGNALHYDPAFVKSIIKRMPIVALDTAYEIKIDGVVFSDDDSGIKSIVKAIAKKGHKDVVFLASSPEVSTGKRRADSFRKYAKAAGLKLKVIENVDNEESACLNTMRLFVEKKKFTAIACWNDSAAAGALRYMNSNGVKVPDEVAVTGFGNLDFADKLYPRLTTVEQYFSTMGEEASKIICDAMNNRSYGKPKRKQTKVKLIMRESL